MNESDFKKYLNAFESQVICQGVVYGVLGQKELVATRNGKLSRTAFGRLIGNELNFDHPLAIDYYGFLKKSIGFKEMVRESEAQLRMIECVVVHFAAVKIEEIVEISPNLVAEFPVFKQQMLKRRGFKK
jgi:hypothetical protein